MKTIKTTIALLFGAIIMTSCGEKAVKKESCCTDDKTKTECTSNGACNEEKCSHDSKDQDCKSKCSKDMKFTKKYTNADFYKDGVFQQDVAKKAFYEMFEFYGYPVTPLLEKDAWYTDFGMGDFEHCGMGGIFWVNDKEHGYFAHDIYLLPGQMIPEHSHVKTTMPAKFESWYVRNGWCYNFSEIGDATPNAPAMPESQAASIKSKHFVKQNVGEIVHLAKEGSWHFLMAGDEGAIVHEYASYHDGAGLRFSNPKAK